MTRQTNFGRIEMNLKPETLELLSLTPNSPAEADELYKAVLLSEVGHYPVNGKDAQVMIERVVASKKYPWVKFTDTNCCSAVYSYWEGKPESSVYQSIEMLAGSISDLRNARRASEKQ